MDTPAKPRLMRLDDVSDRTGVPVETLRYWRKKGTGPPSTRLGRRVVYREDQVEDWIKAQFANAS